MTFLKKILTAIKNFFVRIGKFLWKHKKACIAILIIAAILFGVWYKFFRKTVNPEDMQAKVQTTEVQKMDLQSSISVTGTLAAANTASVTSTASGVSVESVNYEVGDYVEAGSVVVNFDGDDLDEKVSELDAKYLIQSVKDQKTLQDYLDQIDDYKEQIEETQEYLDTWNKVYLNLIDARDQYYAYPYIESFKERYQTETQAANSNYGVSIDGYESKQKELEELQTKLSDAQYNYNLALLEQAYTANYEKQTAYDEVYEQISSTQVTAPISGYITAINVEEGNNYTQGSTVFTISSTDSYVVEATVDEYDIASLTEGMSCLVKFDSTDDEEFSGTLTYVAIAPESSSSSTGNSQSSGTSSTGYSIKIALDSTDDRLRIGMTAKASVILESVTDVYAVAYDCVETDADGNSYITEVDDAGNETRIQVTLGLQSDYYVEIQSDELTEGMKIKATASSSDNVEVNESTESTDESSDSLGIMMDDSGSNMGGGDMGGGAPSGGGAPGGGF